MKNIKSFILRISLILSSAVLFSCGGNSTSPEIKTELGKEHTSAYVCPMHCEGSGSDKAGECPVCGMKYEKNKVHNSNEHNH